VSERWHGNTPLHLACSFDIAKMLCEEFGEYRPPLSVQNNAGATPLQRAEWLEKHGIIVYLSSKQQ